jgi:hypothetical protein
MLLLGVGVGELVLKRGLVVCEECEVILSDYKWMLC